MRFAKVRLLIVAAATVLLPLGAAPLVLADDAGTLYCASEGPATDCDLAIDKQVKVNDGEFTEAPTAAKAVSAKVGDTITWQITVTYTGPDYQSPDGTVTVDDILPANVTYVSSSVDPNYAGTYTDGVWTFELGDALPATLTIVTTAKTTGLMENTATLSDYEAPCWLSNANNCIDPPYNDANATNNVAHAFVNIPAPKPAPVAQVKAPAAPDTGFGVPQSNPWASLTASVIAASAIFGVGLKLRRVLQR